MSSTADSRGQQRSALGWMALLLYLGVVALLLLLPPAFVFHAVDGEQRMTQLFLGIPADTWITHQIASNLAAVTGLATDLTTRLTGNDAIDLWLVGRLYVTVLWSQAVLYRAFLALLWFVVALPFVIACAADGFYRREISKTSFSSQSPILHKRGMMATKCLILGTMGLLVLPVRMPVILIPFCIILAALSLRMWIAHAPKRL